MYRKIILALVAAAALGTTFLIPTDVSARSGGYAARSSHFAGVRSSVARPTVSRSFAHPRINRGFAHPSMNRGFAHPTVSRSRVVKWSRFANQGVGGRPAAGPGSHIIWQRPLNPVTNPAFAPLSGKLVAIPTPDPLKQPGEPVVFADGPGSPPAPGTPPGAPGTPPSSGPGTPPSGPGTPPNGSGASGNPPTGPRGPVIVNVPGPVTRPGTVIVTARSGFGLPTVGTYGRVAQATPVNPTTAYLAIALAWNDNGAWIARIDTSLDQALPIAQSTCDQQYGDCKLAPVYVAPTSFRCMAVARSDNANAKLYAATDPSKEGANNVALQRCQSVNGGSCTIEYSACNASTGS